MPSWAEVFADWPESSEEALGMARRLEAAHRVLALACRLMRILRAVVQPSMATMLHARHDLLMGSFVAAELVRDQHTRDVLAPRKQLAEDLLGGYLVASALHQDIQDVPVLVDCPPHVVGFAVDLQEHLVE